MNELELKNYNLEKTLLGGQSFNWDRINGIYYGFTTDKIIKIQPKTDLIFWQTYPQTNDYQYISKLLNFEKDFDTILTSINKDKIINKAIAEVKNVRLLKQDFAQTLLSFILTSNRNINSVRKIVRMLANIYGNKIIVDNMQFSLFPTLNQLSNLTISDIQKLGTGYRAEYFSDAVKRLLDNENLESYLESLSEEEARNELLKFKGIGNKIADCILVFALGFYELTPIDIWAQRVVQDIYSVNYKSNYEHYRNWYKNYFKENTAWAGQFLFEYIRFNYKKTNKLH